MLTNSSLTVYHKSIDENTHFEIWTRFNYDNVWFFGGKGASINKGYENANDVEIRIPYKSNKSLNVENFSIGDILVQGNVKKDIYSQQELTDFQVYNITSIKNNTFGINQHIHIGGK